MAAMRRRKPPKTDAIEHAAKTLDKTAHLEVRHINSFKGRGVFAKAHFQKGDFVVEYRGELISSEESQRRRRVYDARCTVFMFDFYWQERTWCIDAAREDGSLGRLVSDDHNHPNCKMKKVLAEGKPHLFLFALRDINPGEEITYDYGGNEWPWRKRTGIQQNVTKSSEAEMSRTQLSPQRSTSFQIQVRLPQTVTKSSEAEMSRTQLSPQRFTSSQIKVRLPQTVTKLSEAEMSRTQLSPQSSTSCQIKVRLPQTVTNSSEAEMSRTQLSPQRSTSSQIKVRLPQAVTKSSEAEMSRTQLSPQRSTPSQIKVRLPQTVTNLSEAEMSRTQLSPQRSTSTQIKVRLPQAVTKSSEAEMSRTQLSPQRSTPSQIKVRLPQTVTNSSEAEMSRTQLSPQRSTSTQIKVRLPQAVTKSSEAEMSRTQLSPQRSTSSQIKVRLPQTVTKSSEAEMSRTQLSPQRSTSSQIKVRSPQAVTKSSEAEMSTIQLSPQRSTPSQIKTRLPKAVTKLSEAEMSRTQLSPQRSASSQIKAGLPQTVTKSSEAEMSRTQLSPQRSTFCQIKARLPQTVTKSSEAEMSRTQLSPQRSTSSQIKAGVQQTVTESSEAEIARGDEYSIPRLAKTNSIQINNQIYCEPSDLFDLTSDDSGEEFIPKSSEEYSDDTHTSEVIELINKDPSKPRFRHPSLMDGIQDWCLSTTELDSEFSKQVLMRGSSTSAQGKSSGGRHKKRHLIIASSPTQTGLDHSSKQSGRGDTGTLLETSTLDLEQNLPDSTTSPPPEDGVTDGPLSIPAVRKKENGNFSHNVDVVSAGVGNLVPRKQPKQDSQAQNFLHCAYCQDFFTKKLLWQHMKICKFKPGVSQKPGKNHGQALCAFAVPPPFGVKVEFWKLLNNMVQDEVYFAVKSDVCILEYGEHLYNWLGYDVGKHESIRQKLRELGRLLVCSRKNTPLKTIEDHIKPANFMHVVQTVKQVAGYDEETNTYKCPSLALKIGPSLTKISLLVESRANVQGNCSTAKDAGKFRKVYKTRWNELISDASLRTLQESKWNAPLLLPFIKDVQTLHSYLDVQQQHLHSELSTETSPQVWAQLAKVTLTQVILFNRQRAGEVSKMRLSAYLSQNPSDSQEDVNFALSDLERKLCQHFKRIEIRGKRGRKVPVLLTPAMQQALDLLVSKRKECGVPQENIYLFARPSAFTCYRGSDCLRHFAKVCGAENPDSLISTRLRKQTGTLSQVLNLSNTELDQLAGFLGHDIRVHRQFYRLREGTLQLAKISKVLMALDQGRPARFKGQTLDDTNIGPAENVHMDSDDEDASHLQESSHVTSSQREEKETAMPDVSIRDGAPQECTMTPPQAHPHQLPKGGRGRKSFKRRVWKKEEILAVEKHMMSFITTCRVPRKSDCDKCLKLEKVALEGRNWLAIKFYIKNRITALKNTV